MQRGKRVPIADRILCKFLYWFNKRAIRKNKKPLLGFAFNIPSPSGPDIIIVDYSLPRARILRFIRHELMHSISFKLNPLFKSLPHSRINVPGVKNYLISEGFANWGSYFLFPVRNLKERMEVGEFEFEVGVRRMERKIPSLGKSLITSMDEAYLLAAYFFKRVYERLGLNHIIYIMKNPDVISKEDISDPEAYISKVSQSSR